MNAPPKNPTTANRLRRDCVRRGHRHRSLSKLALFRCAFLFDFPSQRPSANLTDGVIYARVSACTKSARNDECAAFSEPARNRVEITDDVGVVMDARPRRGTWRDRRGKAFCSFDGAVSESDPPSVIPRVHAPIRRRFIYGDDHDDRAACVRDVVKTGSTAFDFTACHGREWLYAARVFSERLPYFFFHSRPLNFYVPRTSERTAQTLYEVYPRVSLHELECSGRQRIGMDPTTAWRAFAIVSGRYKFKRRRRCRRNDKNK